MGDLRREEYQSIMRARQMYRKYGDDFRDVMWAEEALVRLEQKAASGDYCEQDRADFKTAKAIFARVHAKSGYDPNQPRVAAGHSDGGQWTATGGGTGRTATPSRATLPRRKPVSSLQPLRPALTPAQVARLNRSAPPGLPPEELEIDPRFGVPRWQLTGAVGPSMSPFDLVGAGGAIRAAGHIAKATVSEAMAVGQVLRARILGKKPEHQFSERVRLAADAVEEFLGGQPALKDIKIDRKRPFDITAIKGNKKFRMDITKTGHTRDANGNRVKESPHFHLLRQKENGDWVDATKQHRIFFTKNGDLK